MDHVTELQIGLNAALEFVQKRAFMGHVERIVTTTPYGIETVKNAQPATIKCK